MNLAFKILLIIAVFSSFLPMQEIYDFTLTDTSQHNCCNDTSTEKDNHNTCTPLCQCSNYFKFIDITQSNLSLEVKFINYQTNINKFAEEQTEPVFHPPIV